MPEPVELRAQATELLRLAGSRPLRSALSLLLRRIADLVVPQPTDLEIAKTAYDSLHSQCRVRQTLLDLADEIDRLSSPTKP